MAPLRIDLTGGFTDVEPFPALRPVVHVNAALSAAVSVRIARGDGRPAGQAGRRQGDVVCLRYRDYHGHEDDAAFELPAGDQQEARQEARQEWAPDPRWEIVQRALAGQPPGGPWQVAIEASGPHGAGLGFSATLLVALLAAAGRLAGHPPATPSDLAERAFAVENSGSAVAGRQDHYAAAYGGINAFTFSAKPPAAAEDLWSPATADFLGATLSIVHAPGTRRSTDVVGPVARAIAGADPRICGLLHQLDDLHEPLVKAISASDQAAMARAFRQVLRLQLALHDQILDPALGVILARLSAVRPCGAKLLGAGGPGGSLLVAHPEGLRPLVAAIAGENGNELIAVEISRLGAVAGDGKQRLWPG